MYKKCTSQSDIYTKNVQTVQNLYKVQTKNSLKLEMYILCTYKQCTNYTKATSKLKQTFYVIWTYTHCINYTKCMQMLIESCVAPIYDFCVYKNPRFFNF